MVNGEIGTISIKNNSIVVGSNQGKVIRYAIIGSQIYPEDIDMVDYELVDAAIISLSMDDFNNEGLIGTEAGSIYYVNF